MSSRTHLSHRRTHNLLLIGKLLNQRDHTSPFTLILDTLEQPAREKLLVGEYTRRACLSKSTHVIYLSFETFKNPSILQNNESTNDRTNAERQNENQKLTFIKCHDKNPTQIASAVSAAISSSVPFSSSSANNGNESNQNRRNLILIDSLHPLCTLSLNTKSPLNLAAFLSSFLAPQPKFPSIQTSLVAIYHSDVPLPAPSPASSHLAYAPSPLSMLMYLATTVLRVHSLSIALASKEAEDRSQTLPSFGLAEEKEGVLIGLKPNKSSSRGSMLRPDEKGIILELEHRRKSGRGVREWYFLPESQPATTFSKTNQQSSFKEVVTLLDDHPLFRKTSKEDDSVPGGPGMSEKELAGMTFELGLTDRQKLERDGVVLPYFDAQKGGGLGGPGEGGRILYDMGSEDDFDEEEDEI